MTTSYKLDTSGIDKLLQGMDGNADKAVRDTAYEIRDMAAGYAPVRTGALRDSLEAVKVTQKTWWVQDGVEYGVYQELGTSKMGAQPFLTPAVEQAEQALAERLAQEVFNG